MGENYVEVMPEASRIMEGLRDTGYEFNTAVADIVDNSIAANATKIHIKVNQLFSGEIRVSIADNGVGMNRDGLISAMRYGAPERSDKHSLGKFGLGLKTASTSCCRRLKVCSRRSASEDIMCAVWDLDYIANNSDKGWRLLLQEPAPADVRALEDCADESGTIVVWENCDRLLSARYSNPHTAAFADALDRAVESLRFHLSMTFQRFLDHGDERAQDVEIVLNGSALDAWDPFCREYSDSYLGSEKIPFEWDNGEKGCVDVSFYVVPLKENCATLEEKQRIMPSYKNKALQKFSEESLSGFYVYRENRLIHWGDWFGMPGVDFHNKLCRFELSFDAGLDELFQVDIKKSRILLNNEIKETLHKLATPVKAEGKNRYRKKQSKSSKEAAPSLHADTNSSLSAVAPSLVNPEGVVAVSESEARITNKYGVSVVPYSVHKGVGNGDVFVEAVESIEDGLLWAPVLIDERRGVQLNSNHEFYKRFYAVNKDNAAAVMAMNYVLYSLAQAENEAYSEDAQENLSEARYQASRLLRQLAKYLPDASIEDIEGE